MQEYIKKLGSGTTILIRSNDEMKDIIRIVKSLEDSGLLLKGVSETIQNEAKEQKGGFPNVTRYSRWKFTSKHFSRLRNK